MPRKIQPFNYLLLLAIILVGVFSIVDLSPKMEGSYTPGTITDSIEQAAFVNDSMPQKKLKADSLDRVNFCEIIKLRNPGTGLYAGFGGYTLINETDSCHLKNPDGTYKDKAFLVLMGYRLKPSSDFYIQQGKYYLKNTIWENDKNIASGHYVRKEIPARFVANQVNEIQTGLLLLPVSEKKFRLIKTITYIITVLLSAIVIILIFLIMRVLYNIARRNIFSKRNIKDLYITGWTLVAIAITPNILAIIFSLIFAARIPDEFYLPLQQTLLQNKLVLVAGLIVLLIAGGFRNGFRDQLENRSFT